MSNNIIKTDQRSVKYEIFTHLNVFLKKHKIKFKLKNW